MNYSISESGQMQGSVCDWASQRASRLPSTSKSYTVQRDWLFEPKVFAELKNAQSIVIAYDGLNPLPQRIAIQPYYLDPDTTYFEQLARGTLVSF